jgi:hypothetical protein
MAEMDVQEPMGDRVEAVKTKIFLLMVHPLILICPVKMVKMGKMGNIAIALTVVINAMPTAGNAYA